MKKFRIGVIACALALAVAPAFAASTTVEFAGSDGQKLVVEFKDDGTAIAAGGAPVAYTVDEAQKKICSKVENQDVCATFDAIGTEVGFTTNYKDSQGRTGVAKVIAVTK